MKKIFTQFIVLLSLTISSSCFATSHVITASDANFFTPDSLSIPIGDTIIFEWVSGIHTATSDNIPTGAATFDAPLDVSNPSFVYVPSVIGEYNYVCTPHLAMGMIGKFIVNDTATTPGTHTHVITASDAGFFTPDSLTIPIGDTIMFQWIDGTHDAVSTSIPAGAASFNEPLTSSNQSFIYVPTVIGEYNYVCTPHQAMGMVGKFIVEDTMVSIKKIEAIDFNIYPNPVKNKMAIRTDGKLNISELTITNIQGQIILTREITNQSTIEINTINFSDGMYFVKVKTIYGDAIKKFIVNK